MKITRCFVLMLGASFCAFQCEAARNKWDAIVALDSAVTLPPPGSADTRDSKTSSGYRRVDMQSPDPAPPAGGASGSGIALPQLLFILETQLDIPAGMESRWAGALATDGAFRDTISSLLKSWRLPGDSGRSLEGLDDIAELIRTGGLSGIPSWRFNVTPVPPSASAARIKAKSSAANAKLAEAVLKSGKLPKLTKSSVAAAGPFFEIRLVINVDDLGLTEAQRTEVRAQLLKMGVDNVEFNKAISTIRGIIGNPTNTSKYPGGTRMLDTAFPPPATSKSKPS